MRTPDSQGRKLRGRKIGRSWRMTDADVEHMLDLYLTDQPEAAVAPPVSFEEGLSSRSRKRLRRIQ